MDMGAVADPVWIEDRGEYRTMAESIGDRARHLAGDHRLVGGAQTARRADRHLVLARPVFGKKRVRDEAGRAQRRNKMLAEPALAAPGVERIGCAGPLLHPGIGEFLLERGDHGEASLALQRFQRAAQEVARAAGPELAEDVGDVAEIEPLGGSAVELNLDKGAGVRHQHQVALGAVGRVVGSARRATS